MDIVRQSPGIAVLRDDWSPDSPQMKIEIDQIAQTSWELRTPMSQPPTAAAISGDPVGIYKEGNKNIPICGPPPATGSRAAFADRKSLRQLIARERQSPRCFRWRL